MNGKKHDPIQEIQKIQAKQFSEYMQSNFQRRIYL